MRTLTAAFSSSFRRGFPLLSLGVIRKCTIFALLQRMIFSRSHCTLALLAFFLSDFPWNFSDFSTNHSSSFSAKRKKKRNQKTHSMLASFFCCNFHSTNCFFRRLFWQELFDGVLIKKVEQTLTCETSGLLNRFDELLKKRRRMYTGSEIPFRSTTARLFLKPGNARIRLYFWQESGRILNACRANRLRLFLFARLLAKIQSDWDLELGLNFSCCVC